eukprot:7720225-Alexandrium_andersonii.AAC.1
MHWTEQLAPRQEALHQCLDKALELPIQLGGFGDATPLGAFSLAACSWYPNWGANSEATSGANWHSYPMSVICLA